MTLRQGTTAPQVKELQLMLNNRVVPSPRLRVDGVFGPNTRQAVELFQREAGITVDGIAGPQTRKALKEQAPSTGSSNNVQKFVAEIGTLEDFVAHVALEESRRRTRAELMSALSNFFRTASGRRYLVTTDDRARVVDLRHFFAAAAESYSAAKSGGALPVGGTRGDTLLLGVANELFQCGEEALRAQLNSCFAREDLASNRLGAEFGRYLKIKEAERSSETVSSLLRRYLLQYSPVSATVVSRVQAPTRLAVVKETVAALLIGVYDWFVPDAY